MRAENFQPSGVIPATLLLFDADFGIDEPATRRHLAEVAATPGLAAITVNGHSSEVHACSIDEQRRVLDLALDELGDRLAVVSGVYADGSAIAAGIGRMAERAGASALLVFPPQSMGMGGQLRPEMALAHFRCIAEATELPLIVFQYPMASGLGYPFDTLLRLFEAVPTIRAVKDWCGDPMLHERHIRSFRALPRPVTVLTTHSAWLLGSLVMGAGGLLSGAGSVIPELQVALFDAVRRDDLAAARRINDRIFPLAQAFYAPPFLDMHNRMKECLRLLGRAERAVVRPPLVRLPPDEIDRLAAALRVARLLDSEGVRAAAE